MNEIRKRWHSDQRTIAIYASHGLAIQSSPGLSATSNLNHRGQLHLPLNSRLRPGLWMNQWWCSGGVNSAFYEARHNMLTLWKAHVCHVRPVRTAIYNTFTTPSRIVPWNAVHSSSPPAHANPVFRFGFDSVHGGLVKRRNSCVYAACFDVSYARVDACRTLFRKQTCLSTVLCFIFDGADTFLSLTN